MLRVFIWAINSSKSLMEQKCERLLKSAEVHGVEVELLGVGHDFVSHSQRMEILRDTLLEMGEKERKETVVVTMDGEDTLINGSREQIGENFKRLQTKIILSAEKAYSYQYFNYKDKFDNLETPYPYRYVNGGTFMGYGDGLYKLMNELLEMQASEYPEANDQGLLGIWAHRNMENEQLMKLDLNCELFWVACEDWDALEQASNKSESNLENPMTGTTPPIIHTTCLGSEKVARIYELAYQKILRKG